MNQYLLEKKQTHPIYILFKSKNKHDIDQQSFQ